MQEISNMRKKTKPDLKSILITPPTADKKTLLLKQFSPEKKLSPSNSGLRKKETKPEERKVPLATATRIEKLRALQSSSPAFP